MSTLLIFISTVSIRSDRTMMYVQLGTQYHTLVESFLCSIMLSFHTFAKEIIAM